MGHATTVDMPVVGHMLPVGHDDGLPLLGGQYEPSGQTCTTLWQKEPGGQLIPTLNPVDVHKEPTGQASMAVRPVEGHT